MRHATAIALLIALAVPLSGLEVIDVRWGFGGGAVTDRLTLLSVAVANPELALYDGALLLSGGAGAERHGAAQRRSCTLAPGQQRWLQFAVWNAPGGETTLRWHDAGGERSFVLPVPKAAAPQAVYLAGDGVLGRSTVLPQFPAELFPGSVAATDALDAVLLDHVPRWTGARRTAFVDWLCGGGRLFLAHGDDGSWPRFGSGWPEEFDDVGVASCGAGSIVRLPLAVSAIDRRHLQEQGYQEASLAEAGGWMASFALVFHGALRRAVNPEHDWQAMMAIVFCYLLLLFPGQWLLARRIDFRAAIVVGLGVVLLAAAALTVIGRRGYGERTRVDRVSHARLIGDGRYDVTQWGTCFVTASGGYRISHGDGALYATAEDAASPARYDADAGVLDAEIPLFSSQGYLMRAALPGPALAAQLDEFALRGDGELQSLALRLDQDALRPLGTWALYRGRLYRLMQAGERLRLNDGSGTRVAEAVSGQTSLLIADWSSAPTADALAHALISYAAGGSGVLLEGIQRSADDRLALLIAVESDAHFAPAEVPDGDLRVTIYEIGIPVPHQEHVR